MENTIYIALSSQMVLRRQLSMVANNLANVNTPSFKGEQMLFSEYLTDAKNTNLGSNDSKYHFVQAIGNMRDLAEGPMNRTGNELDVAIDGEGYFVVNTEEGKRYTRHGRFQLNQNNELITAAGHVVQSENGGPITIPVEAVNISISTDGTVANGDQNIGKIALVTFEDQQKLERGQNNLYQTDQIEKPPERTNIVQGMLEQSNVNSIIELTQMIEIHRKHDSVKRVIDDEHRRIERMINRLGQSSGQS